MKNSSMKNEKLEIQNRKNPVERTEGMTRSKPARQTFPLLSAGCFLLSACCPSHPPFPFSIILATF